MDETTQNRINVELLERVKAHILEEPRRYNQDTYGEESDIAPCGTAACIAGWTVALKHGLNIAEVNDEDNGPDRIHRLAQEALNLNDAEAATLFGASPDDEWPEPFGEGFDDAWLNDDHASMARIAADYIDWIIKTGKVTE